VIEYWQAVFRSVIDVSPREAIGGLIAGFALALAASGACALLRKRVSDPFPMSCGLILVACVLSMAFGLGHSGARRNPSVNSFTSTNPREGWRVMPPPIGRLLLADADLDGDGRLTPEEAARFVKKADVAGKGWANASEIDGARREWVVRRPIQDFHPDSYRRPVPRDGF
jgi:hypothetical protein